MLKETLKLALDNDKTIDEEAWFHSFVRISGLVPDK